MMDKTYNPKLVEEKLYSEWNEKGYFKATADEIRTFTIVTLLLMNQKAHMGHALNNTCKYPKQWKRLQGYSALWLPEQTIHYFY
jgi:valyl-tRNA synthetase